MRGLIKLNDTEKHPQRSEYVDSLLKVGVKAFIWELTAANRRVSNAVFSVSSYILVLRSGRPKNKKIALWVVE